MLMCTFPSRLAVLAAAVALTASIGTSQTGQGEVKRSRFAAKLVGFQEVPSILTPASGTFKLQINESDTELTYELTFDGLEADSLFAHIHVGQRRTNGGIATFLCGGGTKPDPCPLRGGTVTGTIVAADIGGPTGQGVEANDLADLIRAIRRGAAYANVHSEKYPSGEIRGQIVPDSSVDLKDRLLNR
jgi:CHRD domain.